MKISFCTVSKDRLNFLQQTLPENIRDNEDYDVEFVILNYNSSDGIDDYIRDYWGALIKAGKLSYFKESTAQHFKPAHSRNLCMRLASGDIICNVDADNFTGKICKFINKAFEKNKTIICSPYIFTKQALDTHGRIAIKKTEWLRIGGYDESLIGWGGEDWDLIRRCQKMGWNINYFPKANLNRIPHNDSVRVENVDFGFEVSDATQAKKMTARKNYDTTTEKLKKGELIANPKTWGVGTVTKNFNEIITLKNALPFV